MLKVLTFVIAALIGWIASRLSRGRLGSRGRRPERVARAPRREPTVDRSPVAPPPPARRRGLTPPELQRACFAEMMRHVSLDRGGRGIVPSRYVLRLHPDDVTIIEENRGWFLDGLERALRDAAGDRGWTLAAAVSIEMVADATRRAGVPRAEPAPPAPAPRRRRSGPVRDDLDTAVLIRSDTDERIPLRGRAVTVGRSRDRDVSVDDERVSRRHARFEPEGGGWAVSDERSANGTRVDGERLEPGSRRPLHDGAEIAVGPVIFTFESGAGSRAGVRALADGDRTRISREYLPPDDGVDR